MSGAATDRQTGAAQATTSTREAASDVPLFVDLDGTLVRTDLLFESFLSVVRRDPLVVLRCPFWLLRGRAHLKRQLALRHAVNVQTLPYNDAMLDFLRQQVAGGRTLVLATASHRILADAVAHHVGLFSDVVATDDAVNMAGRTKLAAIREKTGSGPFDYAGNGKADVPIWASARHAVVVGSSPSLRQLMERYDNVALVVPSGRSARSLFTAMRPHQWLKNLLVFVPLLTSVSFTALTPWVNAAIAFMAFCALASSAYLVNDLLDLDADRAHPYKRNRPFAAGAASPAAGLAAAGLLLAAGVALSFLLPAPFVLVACCYLALTLVYTLWLKSRLMADVLTLAGLYTLRVIAGIAAIEAAGSFWLLAFSMALFFSLALVKRCAELVMRVANGSATPAARGYGVRDVATLQALGIGSACLAVLILALYIHSPQVAEKLGAPELLWPACPILMYWLGRVWIKTGRGEMHDDPLVFAARDVASIVSVAAMVALFAGAALVRY